MCRKWNSANLFFSMWLQIKLFCYACKWNVSDVMVGTDIVPEMLVVFNEMTRLVIQKDFIISRREAIASYILILSTVT
jgi:hypothetical protein